MMPDLDTLRATIDHLFAAATRYTYAPPATRRYADFAATLAIPLELAAHGFACRVERIVAGGYALTVTRPAVGTVPKLMATGHGPSWCAACIETRHALMTRLDRIEADHARQRARQEREGLAV